jgi:hypothetical protein
VLLLRELAATPPSALSSTDRVPAPFGFAAFTTTRAFRFYAAVTAAQLGSSSVDDRIFGTIESVTIEADSDVDGLPDRIDNCTFKVNPDQCDSYGDGYGNRCDADLNDNGMVNAQDTILFRSQLGQPSIGPVYNSADLNCNGVVNSQDTALYRGLLGSPPGPSGLHP